MTISVLTLVKDRSLHLANLAEGLRRAETPPGELVIVDMGAAPAPVPQASFPVRVVRLPSQGLPLAAARNRAAEAARHERLIFLDVDCIPSAGLIERLDAVLKEEDALVCADVRYLPAGAAASGWTEAALRSAGVAHPVRRFPAQGLRREPDAGLFWSLAFGLRRSTFDRLGGFDEDFHGYGAEDTDFGFRAREAGLPLLFVGGALAFHQHHGVFDPPLQHFEEILANAATFHARWGAWPMEGWLEAFATLGLVSFSTSRLVRLRGPTSDEVAAARRPDSQAF